MVLMELLDDVPGLGRQGDRVFCDRQVLAGPGDWVLVEDGEAVSVRRYRPGDELPRVWSRCEG